MRRFGIIRPYGKTDLRLVVSIIQVSLWLTSTLATGIAVAQPFPFNEVGVTMGHWHIASRDVQANKKIFVGMGGTPITTGTAESVRFPGVLVNLSLGSAPGSGGSIGSVVNHVGFIVNNVQERVNEATRVAITYSTDPWGTRVELVQRAPSP